MVSRRTDEMTSFIVMDVLEKACEMECRGENVVHLEEGLNRIEAYLAGNPADEKI